MPQAAVGQLTVKLIIPNSADYDNEKNQVRFSVYVRMGFVWVLAPKSGLWIGGAVDGRPAPTVDVPVVGPMTAPDSFGNSWPLYDMRGNPIRVEIEVLRAMQGLGVTVTSRVPAP